MDQTNGINKRDLAQLSSSEKFKAIKLNRDKLEIFYFDAYKEHSNLAIQTNASIQQFTQVIHKAHLGQVLDVIQCEN